jgi:asparagine synthase (glutamine-hydrolysing)
MCGIAGGTGANNELRRRVIRRQLETLTLRGPDSMGFLPGTRATVGQTRLAVIDVEHGDPPLTDESGQVRVAFNGEIYNFRELMDGLLKTGHTFVSRCDTEVIAHLAEQLEPVELAAALDGMFAFAVWDERRGRLTLGRDRLGKKPLYYWTDGTDLVFGSEIKAVLADPRVPRRLDVDALPGYLAHGYVPTPGTFYEGIRSLPPACVLVWEDGDLRIEQYWRVSAPGAAPLPGDAAEHVHEVRRLLTQAVRSRLIADVPLGAFLSGGIDSTAVVGLMAEASSGPVRTFCVGFTDPAYDEREWARLVANRFGTDHTEVVVSPDASLLLDDVLTACDQPFADSSALPTFLLSQETRRHVTVALSGDGGDELFAGYERFAVALGLERLQRLPGPAAWAVRALGGALTGGDYRSLRTRGGRLLRQVGVGLPESYLALLRVFDRQLLDELVPGSAVAATAPDLAVWQSTEGPVLTRLLELNRRTYLLDDLLVKVDRMSMAHGLEVRSPLLDRRLLEYVVRVPAAEQLHGRSLKVLLKQAVADLLPAEILARPKRGFGVPLDRWFREELAQETAQRLATPKARLAAHVSQPVVARLVDEHQRGRAAHGQRLWSLLMLERFLEREGW